MILSILTLIILILINGLFSASELAFLSLDKITLQERINKKDKTAIKINNLLNNKSSFLSTIQISITLVGFLASAFAASYFADYLIDLLPIVFISNSFQRPFIVIIITLILSYFTLVFGELVPKKIAINNPYKVASSLVNLITIVNKIFYPLVKLLSKSTELICKLLNIVEKKESFTEEDIKKMIITSSSSGIIEEKEKDYILNIFNFNDITLDKVMTPKDKVILLNIDDDLRDNILKMKKNKYTRFPIYKNNPNNIIGILNVKDFIYYNRDNNKLNIKDIIRPVSKFNYNDKIDDIFHYMQKSNESIVLVYKKDKFIGIITIEDAIEEIVGNIYDEFDIQTTK